MKNGLYLTLLTFLCAVAYGDEEGNPTLLLANVEVDRGSDSILWGIDPALEQHITIEQIQIEKSQRDYRVLVFGHPMGMGVGIRSSNDRINYECDLSLSPWFASASINSMIYFSSEKHWYAGIGLGVFCSEYNLDALIPYVPLTIGYWGKTLFADFGLDLHPIMFFFGPIPTLRLGFHF